MTSVRNVLRGADCRFVRSAVNLRHTVGHRLMAVQLTHTHMIGRVPPRGDRPQPKLLYTDEIAQVERYDVRAAGVHGDAQLRLNFVARLATNATLPRGAARSRTAYFAYL